MTTEEMIMKFAKKFGGKSFAVEDFKNKDYIDDAVSFASGMYIILPRLDEIKSLTSDGNNLYVARYNPYMLLVAKAAVAANFGHSEYNGKRITYIFVDNLFESLNEKSQRAIIAHEIGHTMSNHSAAHNLRTLKKEGQADSYAASIVGINNMVVALSKMGASLNFISRIELKIRIHMLKKQAQ